MSDFWSRRRSIFFFFLSVITISIRIFAARVAFTLLLLGKSMNVFIGGCLERKKKSLCIQDCGLEMLHQYNSLFWSFLVREKFRVGVILSELWEVLTFDM